MANVGSIYRKFRNSRMICRHLSFKNRGDAGNSKPAKRCGGWVRLVGPITSFFHGVMGPPFLWPKMNRYKIDINR